jgi:hypothetical protein
MIVYEYIFLKKTKMVVIEAGYFLDPFVMNMLVSGIINYGKSIQKIFRQPMFAGRT